MRILLTGATGFIGGALAARLAGAGHELRCIVRPGSDRSRLPAGAAIITGSLADTDTLARELSALAPGDALIHTAGVTKAFSRRGFTHVNEELTRGLAECARAHGPEGLLFLHVSSQAAVGPCASPPGAGEDDQPAPVSQYGLSKLLGERAVLALAPRLRVAVARPAMVYGPGDRAFVPLYRLMARGLLTISGPPGQRLSIVHVDDLVDGLLLVLNALREKRAEGIYHLAGPEDMDWPAYATAFGAALDKRVRILRAPTPLVWAAAGGNALARLAGLPTSHLTPDKCREAAQNGWLLDCGRARRELGYAPSRSLADGAATTIEWCRADGLVPAGAWRDDGKRPRLAVLLQDLEFGGTQRFALNLLSGIDRERFDAELWTLNTGGALLPQARAAGIRVRRVSLRPPGSPLAVAALARLLFRRRPDILFTLTVVPNIWGRIFGRLARVPAIVAGYRGLNPKQWEILLWRCCERVVCNAEALRKRVVKEHGAPAARVAVIPNCVDARHFAPRPEPATDPLIVSVARLVPDKDPLTLAEAFALVLRKIPDARLVLVGEGPLRVHFETRLDELGVRGRVEIVAGCGDPAPHLARARVFALASVREGSPNAVIEAMAAGLPVVARRVGGVPELVVHGETGLLAEPDDAVGLAAALVRLLRDPELAARFGRAGREKVLREHSAPAMIQAVERVLLEAWNARRRP